jgi:hypothetical protein
LIDNPYHVTSDIEATLATKSVLHWRLVLVAYVIVFGSAILLGFAWGIVAFGVYFFLGASADASYMPALASVLGWLVSLAPVMIGTVFICRSIDQSRVQNCLLLAFLNLLACLPFVSWENEQLIWSGVYHLVELTLAVAVGASWNRLSQVRLA